MNIVEFDQECKSCMGTGLYVVMAERDGAAVVCHTCEGTGCKHIRIEYEPFKARKHRDDVLRVYKANPGICIGEGDQFTLGDFGGMPYSWWESGRGFPEGSENRNFTCPRWWVQSAGPEGFSWDEWPCTWGAFSQCPEFPTKVKCWERYDKERHRKSNPPNDFS